MTRDVARAVARRPEGSSVLPWLAGLVTAVAILLTSAAQARSAPESFADLAEKLLPSVVNISTTQTVQSRGPAPEMPQFPPGSPFEEFFKEFFDRQQPGGRPQRATSLGSGFVVDADGYIVTNNHVIAEADEITVILKDETSLKAEIVGRDAKTDLALLKVKTDRKLPAVQWGDSDAVRVGDWVMAIGNPFGLGGTVTAGILSARSRDINAGPYDDFLQTDAPINRGNSGGPMFNMQGQVIGINTAIYSPSGGSVGIGFAIPAAVARPVVEQLRKYGHTRRGWLGVRIQGVSEEIAESLGLKDAKGALIASVNPGGPADKAKIRPGDVVLKFDGKDIPEMRKLPRAVAETEIGREVDVLLWRDGKAQQIKVTVGEMKEAETAALTEKGGSRDSNKPEGGSTAVSSLGLTLTGLTPEIRGRFNLGDRSKGVVVTEVKPNGPAAEKGLRPGDVIVEVGQEEVKTPADVAARVEEARKAGRKSVLLLVEGQSGLRFVAIRVDKG